MLKPAKKNDIHNKNLTVEKGQVPDPFSSVKQYRQKNSVVYESRSRVRL